MKKYILSLIIVASGQSLFAANISLKSGESFQIPNTSDTVSCEGAGAITQHVCRVNAGCVAIDGVCVASRGWFNSVNDLMGLAKELEVSGRCIWDGKFYRQ